jgi:hypothetical protein
MFKDIWYWALPYLALATIMRYIIIRKMGKRNIVYVFSINFNVNGGEAATLMAQLIGITWVLLGLIFDKFIGIQKRLVENTLSQIVFYGPIVVWVWLLSPLIRKS